jgi:thiamine-phosphate pyrophosphorylase
MPACPGMPSEPAGFLPNRLPRLGRSLAFAYYITDRRQLGTGAGGAAGGEEALRRKVRDAFAAGVDYVQLREKDVAGKLLAGLIEEFRALPERSLARRPPRLLVNDRLDVAIACGADGVHLPSDSLPLAAVKSRAGSASIVGISCHSEEEVAQAGRDGASYVLFGPVFETTSKPDGKPVGVPLLRQVCRRSLAPVFAWAGSPEITPNPVFEPVRLASPGFVCFRKLSISRSCPAIFTLCDSREDSRERP